jgi:hypothetical protein
VPPRKEGGKEAGREEGRKVDYCKGEQNDVIAGLEKDNKTPILPKKKKVHGKEDREF